MSQKHPKLILNVVLSSLFGKCLYCLVKFIFKGLQFDRFLIPFQQLLNSDPQWTVASALRSPLLSRLWSCPPRNLSAIQVTIRTILPSHLFTTNSLPLSLQSLSRGSQTTAQVSCPRLRSVPCLCGFNHSKYIYIFFLNFPFNPK